MGCKQSSIQVEVQALAEKWRRNYGLPGVWCAVMDRGVVVAKVAVGFSNVKKKTPASVDHHVVIGSISKVISSAMISSFVDNNVLAYSSKVGDIFPNFKREFPSSLLLNATLADLITHTGGLPLGPDVSFEVPGPEYRLNTLRQFLGSNLVRQPNQSIVDSNQGMPIAVAMVEHQSGTAYEDWLKGKTAKDIGINDPRQVNTDDDSIGGYELSNRALTFIVPPVRQKRAFAPQDAFCLSLDDIMAFARFTMAGSSHLSKGTYSKLITPFGRDQGGRQYTLGGWSLIGGGRYLFHSGSLPGHYAELYVCPALQRAVFFYTNCTSPSDEYMKEIGTDIWELRVRYKLSK